jgi:phosphoglycolate phosphatase
MPTASRLVLFDIDGTLIQTGRAGLRGMNAAFRRLHGRDDALTGISFAGRTDRAIVADAFQALGVDADAETTDALRDAYLGHLIEEMGKPVPDSRVLPGVHASLAALESRADIALGLLTGNYRRGAAIKLGHFGLWDRFRFGAFGDEHTDRRELVPVALEAAHRAIGVRLHASRAVVIGDTPLDVDCAHAHGALAIAVATGPFSRDELAAHKPDLLLESLEDVAALGQVVDRLDR